MRKLLSLHFQPEVTNWLEGCPSNDRVSSLILKCSDSIEMQRKCVKVRQGFLHVRCG